MASFQSFELWYRGNNPYQVIRIVRDNITPSGVILIETAEPGSMCLAVFNFNDEYFQEMKDLLDSLIATQGGEYHLEKPTYILNYEWIEKKRSENND